MIILNKNKFYVQTGETRKYILPVTLRTQLLKNQIKSSELDNIPVPFKDIKQKCRLVEVCYDKCTKCPIIKTYTVFDKDSITTCLGTPGYCWYPHKDTKLLYSTLCSICTSACDSRKYDLTPNHPVEVSNDSVTFCRRHFAYAGKTGIYCYTGGATSATSTKMERWRFLRSATEKNSYRSVLSKFSRVSETGKCNLEEDTLVSISPNFLHNLYYATGEVTENGVEVYAAGETGWSKGEKVILEFPVWELH